MPVPVYDKPSDFVCCASELEPFKDKGAIEILQLLLNTTNYPNHLARKGQLLSASDLPVDSYTTPWQLDQCQ